MRFKFQIFKKLNFPKYKFFHLLIPLVLFVGIYLVYKFIYPEPRDWYDHYLHLARSIMQKRVDVPTLPAFYHDKLEFGGRIYIPFPPGASLLLIPFLWIKETVTQQQVSVVVGALDISLIYLLLSKLTSKRNSILLAVFLGLGTPFFWSAVVGTTWFFAHVVAIFFITLSLICHFQKKDFLSGIFFALAASTRLPLILSGIFFLLQLVKEKKRFLKFLLGASLWIVIYFGYNYLRFGDIVKNGYQEVYLQYANSSYPYTLRQIINSSLPLFGYFDIKNLPMHLYTFLLMPPDVNIVGGVVKEIKPSAYGMGIIFTSPLLFLALRPFFKRGFELNSFLTAAVVAVPSFLHIMQGWVQFGYRFVLDFIVFLLLILALRFKPTKLNISLLLISILVNFWGVIWAINLGW